MDALNIADVKQAHQEKKTSRFKNVEEQALDTFQALKKAEKMEMEHKKTFSWLV